MDPKKKNKPDALKAWMHWGKNAVELLREKGVDLENPTPALNRRVESMVVARAYAETLDKPKIQLNYEYPIPLFLRGNDLGDAFESALADSIQVAKMFVPFSDGSVLLVQTPSEHTVKCAAFIFMFENNQGMCDLMGVDATRLSSLHEIVEVVDKSNRLAVLTEAEISAYVEREHSFAGMRNEPQVQVNLSPERIPASQAANILRKFFNRPTDTISCSVDEFIQQEFVAKVR